MNWVCISLHHHIPELPLLPLAQVILAFQKISECAMPTYMSVSSWTIFSVQKALVFHSKLRDNLF